MPHSKTSLLGQSAEQKSRAERKRVVFVHAAFSERARIIGLKKIAKQAIFFITCRFSKVFFNSREAIAAIIGDIVVLFIIQRCLLKALSFFKICSPIFMIFEVKLGSDFGHAETGNGAKKRVVLRREFFCSNFKVM